MKKINSKQKKFIYYLLTILVLVLALSLSLMVGIKFYSPKEIFNLLFLEKSDLLRKIFFEIRVPRTFLACLTGMLLAGSGVVFQSYFRNPLAEAGVMGISSGATLGAVIAVCSGFGAAGWSYSVVNGGAFLGALVAGLLVIVLAGIRGGKNSTVSLLLCGSALGALYSALITVFLSVNNERLQTMYLWMVGSFSGRGWNELRVIIFPALASIMLMFFLAPSLDLFSGGEVSAQSLGVNVPVIRMLVILTGALAVSAAVCAGGTIGFVGLIGPHIARFFFGTKVRVLLPGAMFTGAVITLLADVLCRVVIAPAELPVGIITAILGAPFFISLMLTGRGRKTFG